MNDLQPGGDLEYASVHDCRGDVPHGEGESDFVVHGFGGEPQPHILRDEPDEAGGVAWGSQRAVGAGNVDVPVLGAVVEVLEQSAHAVQQAGFARSGRADDDRQGAGLERDVELVEVPVCAEIQAGIRQHHGCLADAGDGTDGRKSAGLHGRSECESALDGLFKNGYEQ